ncbi:hypothetical protein GGS24DRAFT_293916 [Hypoxylon argillaceum]|nr:hypothetical protein GGS24DRAFT_293916 [Hypoxylon argillaceum]
MRASFIFALLPATCTFAAMIPRQDSTSSAAPSATSSPAIPCPTAPDNCASKLNGHLICLNARTWCLYTDTTRYTPAFFPVDLENPCAPCLTVV